MEIPYVGVGPFPLIHRFAIRRRSFLLIMHRTYVYSTISNCEGCVGFIVEKGPLLSNVVGVFGLWNDLLFHCDPCCGFLLCVFHIFLWLCLFPSHIVWEFVLSPFFACAISLAIALRIRCCGFIVVCGLLFAHD